MGNISPLDRKIKRAMRLNFGLFACFFVFYVGAAVLQTPTFKSIAEFQLSGIPFGLLVSLAIFPLSWLILIIWFRRSA